MKRFRFTVRRNDIDITVTMHGGGRVYRCRTMSEELLEYLARSCEQVKEEYVARLRDDPTFRATLPRSPHCVPVAEVALVGACDIQLLASRTDDGDTEFSIAFYDAANQQAPALLLVEEQIDEFIAIVRGITRPVSGTLQRPGHEEGAYAPTQSSDEDLPW